MIILIDLLNLEGQLIWWLSLLKNKILLKSFLFIGFFWMLGEVIRYFLLLPISGSIIGMLCIFISLRLKWIHLKQVKLASDILLKYLTLFFVPYGVGLMTYYKMIETNLPLILFAVILSSALTLYVTAILIQKYGQEWKCI